MSSHYMCQLWGLGIVHTNCCDDNAEHHPASKGLKNPTKTGSKPRMPRPRWRAVSGQTDGPRPCIMPQPSEQKRLRQCTNMPCLWTPQKHHINIRQWRTILQVGPRENRYNPQCKAERRPALQTLPEPEPMPAPIESCHNHDSLIVRPSASAGDCSINDDAAHLSPNPWRGSVPLEYLHTLSLLPLEAHDTQFGTKAYATKYRA